MTAWFWLGCTAGAWAAALALALADFPRHAAGLMLLSSLFAVLTMKEMKDGKRPQ